MTSRSEVVTRARDAEILEVASRVGGRLKRVGGAEFAGPCPACGGDDRFAVNAKRRVFNCRGFGGGDVIAMTQHALGLNFADAIKFVTGADARQLTRRATPAHNTASTSGDDDAQRARALKHARQVVAELVPIAGTPVEAYLNKTRNIDTAAIQDVLTRADAIGWHPAVYFNQPGHELHGRRLGCIVGVMTDAATAKSTGAISRTYIAGDLTKIGKAKTLGAPAGIVRLTPDDEVLGGLFIAEGIETGLDAMSIGLRPVWATGSTSLMSTLPVLPGIEALNLLVDHDENGAGECAARAVEARWRAARREVNLWRPRAFGDLNDFPERGRI